MDLWISVHCSWNWWMKTFLFSNLRASLIKSDHFRPTQIYPHFSRNKGEGVFWPLSPLWRCKRRELDIGISTLILLHPPTVRHNHTCVMFTTNSSFFTRKLSFVPSKQNWLELWTGPLQPHALSATISLLGWVGSATWLTLNHCWNILSPSAVCPHFLIFLHDFALFSVLSAMRATKIENIQFMTVALIRSFLSLDIDGKKCFHNNNTFFSLIPTGQCWAMRTCGLGPQRTELD